MSDDALYEARDLHITYQRGRRPPVRAVDGVDLTWRRGETLGLVGESGCGKSTLARTLLGLEQPSAGSIDFDGRPVSHDLRALRRRVQMIFQDPYQSLNPRRTVGAQVQEGLAAIGVPDGDERVRRGVTALHDAGLSPADRFWSRYPHELSGGQRQRVVIAAALALEPEALVCDEPVSALDVCVRTQVLRLLVELRETRSLSLLLITHDVGMAWSLCDRVAVMYLGRIVEIGTTEQVLGDPQHPYTKALLAVAPKVEQRTAPRQLLTGEPPDATAIPSGCRFHPRCPVAFERCPVDDPRLPEVERGAACWLRLWLVDAWRAGPAARTPRRLGRSDRRRRSKTRVRQPREFVFEPLLERDGVTARAVRGARTTRSGGSTGSRRRRRRRSSAASTAGTRSTSRSTSSRGCRPGSGR